MPETIQLPKEKKWLAGKVFQIFLIITDIVAWLIIIWQNWAYIYNFLHKLSWLFVLLTKVIILPAIAIALLFWVFSTSSRRSQIIRAGSIIILLISGIGVFWLINTSTAQTTPSTDTFGNTMMAFFIIITAIFGSLAAIAAILVLVPSLASQQQPIIISFTPRASGFANWINQELQHKNYTSQSNLCQQNTLLGVLKEIRKEIAQGRLVILLLSPAYPLIQQFKWHYKFLLRLMNIYYHNIKGKGTFILIYTEKCPTDKQKALLCFKPIDLNDGEETAKMLILERVKGCIVN